MQGKNKVIKYIGASFFLLILFFFGLPLLFTKSEFAGFSDDARIEQAKKKYSLATLSDSVTLVPGRFYRRGEFLQWLLGSTYRQLWLEPVKVPVLRLKSFAGGLTPVEFGGGQQTIGMDARDSSGQIWSIRSVNKDQAGALPRFLRGSVLRPLFRDQASALNPYAAVVVAKLSKAIGVNQPTPKYFLFPFDPSYQSFNDRMAGRLVMVVKDFDAETDSASKNSLLSTDEMLSWYSKGVGVDTALYLRCRLFDMLISDWDRHQGNWKWLLVHRNGTSTIKPVPVDRDMAFYNFGDGALNRFVLLFVNKFQSFEPEVKSVKGLMGQSKSLDVSLLATTNKAAFIREAHFIQRQLQKSVIVDAFQEYPANIYSLVGKQHQAILLNRLQALPVVAVDFHDLIQRAR